MKKICIECGKPLRLIGRDRKNGKDFEGNNGKDWDNRKRHKKCYKTYRERISLERYLSNKCVNITENNEV
tara:strand:- start:133 stop:342 length:210 start_codon:yes stop_codon:yes gene_type:complete